MVEICVDVGGSMMFLSLLSSLRLPHSSVLIELPQSRLIGGCGSLEREVGSGGSFPLCPVSVVSGGLGDFVGLLLG